MNKILGRRNVFSGKVVRVDEVDLDFGGKKSTYELINFSSVTGVSALPIDDDGNLVLIKHFQLGLSNSGWSLPTGGLAEGEVPEERMQLELMEEAGFRAGSLKLMVRVHTLPGYVGSEPGYIYLAEKLSVAQKQGDEDFPIEVAHLPFDIVLEKLRSGEIVDCRTIMAVLYYQQFYRNL